MSCAWSICLNRTQSNSALKAGTRYTVEWFNPVDGFRQRALSWPQTRKAKPWLHRPQMARTTGRWFSPCGFAEYCYLVRSLSPRLTACSPFLPSTACLPFPVRDPCRRWLAS